MNRIRAFHIACLGVPLRSFIMAQNFHGNDALLRFSWPEYHALEYNRKS